MFLVHEKKQRDGKWEVAWMWLPHFLAADRELHKYVDKKMTETFKGTMVEEGQTEHVLGLMHQKVLDLILERYPIPGMRRFLDGYTYLRPDDEDEQKEETGSSV